MLQNLREHAQGWIAGLIAGLLALAFALWGVEYYISSGHSVDYVAKVNGVKITSNQFNAAYERLRQQYIMSAGPAAYNQAAQNALKQQALDQLINREILSQAALHDGYRISANELNSVIMQIPAFQQDGQFSMPRYQQTLNALLYTPQSFLKDLEKNLLVIQQQTGMVESDFALSNETDQLVQLMDQKREVAYLIIPANHFLADAKVSDKDIEAEYKAHQEDFRTPEQVSIDYIELTANDVKAKIVVTEADIQQYYESNSNNFKDRPLSEAHDQIKQILERQALENLFSAQSDKLSDLAYTNPTTLQPVAQALSLPIKTSEAFTAKGSKTGITANPKIVAVAFSDNVLAQNNNSDPIQVGEGDFVVLRIHNHQPSTIKPLAEVKPEIEAQLKVEKAKEQAKALGEKLEQALQQGQSVDSMLAQYHLTWQPRAELTRQNAGVEAAILRAAFATPQPFENKLAVGGASMINGDYAVVRVFNIIPIDIKQVSALERTTVQADLANKWGQFANDLYIQELKKNAKIDITSQKE